MTRMYLLISSAYRHVNKTHIALISTSICDCLGTGKKEAIDLCLFKALSILNISYLFLKFVLNSCLLAISNIMNSVLKQKEL